MFTLRDALHKNNVNKLESAQYKLEITFNRLIIIMSDV